MAVIGAVLGDIAGSHHEFIRPLDYKHCRLFTDRCKFTDDTVMTLATKKAIQNDLPFADTYRKLGRKYPHAGYGGKFKKWLWDDAMGPYNSFGNGSAMRCSYIGEYSESEDEVKFWATASALCTHNHPEGIKGAVVTAMCIYMARTGASQVEIAEYAGYEYSSAEYKYGIDLALKDYRDKYRWSSSCQDSVPVAIRCFIESEDYESFIRNVFSLRCDADSLCAIGGGIAEEYYKGTGLYEDKLLTKYLPKDLYELVKR